MTSGEGPLFPPCPRESVVTTSHAFLRLLNSVCGDGRKAACHGVEGITIAQLLMTEAVFEQPSYGGHIRGAPGHEDGVHSLYRHTSVFEGEVDRGANPLDIGCNPGLEIRAGHIGADVQVARLEQVNKILDLLRSLCVPNQLTQFAEGAGVFEK